MQKLELLNLSKSFSGFKALSDVNIELLSGETHALMGENGAGKTTLIKILAGILKPDQMMMKIDNNIQKVNSAIDSKNLGFNFIHQELNIVSYLSVAENMFLSHPYPMRYGALINWNKIYKLSKDALKQLDITHINVEDKCASLSTGDQMLVKIASCLIKTETSPTLYVFDEPTAALTIQESEKLFKVISNLKKKNAIILYVSHRMNEILEISDRVTVLRDGIKVLTEEISNLSKEKIIRGMIGKDLSDNFPKKTGKLNDKVIIDVSNGHTKNIKNINFKINQTIKRIKNARILKNGIFISKDVISKPVLANEENSVGISLPKIVLPPLTKKAKPLNIVSVPRVATKGRMPIIDTKKPLNKPPITPTSKAAIIPIQMG